MQPTRRAVVTLLFLVCCVAVFGAASACSKKQGALPPTPLADVSPLPSPILPSWIAQVSPRGETKTLAQIRVIFRAPLIPLSAIEDPSQQSKLAQFVVEPAIAGHFRFLTPRMVGFQQDEALPLATRVRVVVRAGLRDLSGHTLDHDLAWTFTTQQVFISDLPEPSQDQQPVSLKPTLQFRSNVELDPQSLDDHVSLSPGEGKPSVPVSVQLNTLQTPAPNNEDQPQMLYDASVRDWFYNVTPQQELAKSTGYVLKISSGLRPARGNVPSSQAFIGLVKTYGALVFKGLAHDSGSGDRFADGSPLLKFNNPLVAGSVQKNLTISPTPQSTAGLWQIGGNEVVINTSWLAPATAYTVSVGAGVTDKFGQTLGKPATVTYNTGNFASNFWAPEGLNIFPADDRLQLDISGVNLPGNKYSVAYSVVQPESLVYRDSAYPDNTGLGLLPPQDQWPVLNASAKRNQILNIAVPLSEKLGGKTGMIAYGAAATTYRYSYDAVQRYFGLVQLTNLGVFAQWFPTQGLVRVHHLSDGSNVAGARITIYGSKVDATSKPLPAPCASGATDSTGTFSLGADAMASCIRGNIGDYGGPTLLTIAREGTDWAYARTDSYSGAYGYGITSDWDNGAPQSRGTIFSDRSLYQPGEKAWFTAAAYYLQKGVLKQDRGARYHVTIEGPNGAKTDLGTQASDDYGMFSFSLPLKANQPLGYYTARAKAANGIELSGDFRVAQFKPPNFKVELALDKEYAYPGDTVAAKASSQYLFGSPVQNARSNYYVTRSQAYFSPKGWDEFSFGRQWFWPENPPSISSDVLQANATLDAAGLSQQAVNVGSDVPYPMTYRVDMQVVDVSNLSVADSKTFTVLPSNALIGIQSEWIGTASKALPVKVIVTDPQGSPQRGRTVTVLLQQMEYSSAAQLVEGGETQRDQVQYKTVATAKAGSANDAQTVTLTPPASGPYRIRANFSDAKDETSATDFQLWVTGPGEINWGGQSRDHLQIKLDKTSYRPGDTAVALIQSPYPQADLYFAVVRNKIIYRVMQHVRGGAPEVRFRVTQDMTPNAAVQAVLVRQGAPLQHLQPGALDSLARTGFAPFSINLDDKYLKVSLSPVHATLEPGSEESVRLQLRDARGHPARGETAVMVVNEAVLQLTAYRPPDLVKTVYAEQPITTRFADNRPSVVLQQIASPLQKGWGYGGGFLAGAAGTRIRTNFQPLAYYNGAVRTDANGNARVTFKTPDDLTTWRVMAVAVGASTAGASDSFHFGSSDVTFVTSKPLITNAIVPQFIRPGDSMQAGLTVTNTTGAKGTLAILASLAGPLVFQEKGASTQTTTLSASAQDGTAAYRFPMTATGVGLARLTFKSALGSIADAFEVPLEVRPPLSVMEQVVDSGVTPANASIPLFVDPRTVNDAGGLEINLASTLLPEVIVPAQKTLDNTDLPFLEPVASRLSVAASLNALSRQYGKAVGGFDPAASAAQSLAQLQRLQQADGGFSWLPMVHGSDVFITPYAAQSIAAAKAAGFPVDPTVIAGVTTYLEHSLANPGVCSGFEPCLSRVRLDILLALADLGEQRNDFLSNIYDQRDRFDLLGQVELARYLSSFPQWRQQSAVMAGKLQESVYLTGRFATINYPEEWGWLESPTAMRAQVLRLFIVRNGDPQLLDGLMNSLLALRRNGAWSDPYENAQALTAIVAYSKLQPAPPNFSATATLAGKTLQSATFAGYQVTNSKRTVAMAALPRNKSDLVLAKSGQGQLHYLVALRYRLSGNRPGQLSGLRITRELRPANEDKVLATMGLAALADPVALSPGKVFDIGLEIITDHPVDHVVITDELPAGLEAVDTTFKTSTPYFEAKGDSWEINYQTIYKDRVVAYGTRLEAGVYSMHYLVRSVTPGTYLWPGADVHLQYAPEEFGRTSTSSLVISEK